MANTKTYCYSNLLQLHHNDEAFKFMEIINRDNHQKLYLQLYDILKKMIESSDVGSQIPTEEEISKMFNVSRATVRTAVLSLVREGYLKRQQGKGTFIYKNAVSEGLTMFTNFRELLYEEGLNFTTDVLARTVMMPIDDLDVKLDISKDKHIIYIKRLRFINNEPILLQESYIPYHICPLLLEEDIEHQSLFDLFEKKYGIKITKVKTNIEITHLKTDEARLIGTPEASAAILLTQYFYSGDTLIMYTCSIKRTDRVKFFIELERKAT
jgi:GntR family transcriptional regulator